MVPLLSNRHPATTPSHPFPSDFGRHHCPGRPPPPSDPSAATDQAVPLSFWIRLPLPRPPLSPSDPFTNPLVLLFPSGSGEWRSWRGDIGCCGEIEAAAQIRARRVDDKRGREDAAMEEEGGGGGAGGNFLVSCCSLRPPPRSPARLSSRFPRGSVRQRLHTRGSGRWRRAAPPRAWIRRRPREPDLAVDELPKVRVAASRKPPPPTPDARVTASLVPLARPGLPMHARTPSVVARTVRSREERDAPNLGRDEKDLGSPGGWETVVGGCWRGGFNVYARNSV